MPHPPDDDEEAARHARELDALGRRTAEIVHDFNNLFQGIIGSLVTLRGHIAHDRTADAESLIERTAAAVQSAADSTHRLLGLVRREPSDAVPVDVTDIVTLMAPLLRGAAGDTMAVDLNLAEGLSSVLCDRNALENALLNLVVNARDAMAEGGSLTITTSQIDLDARDAVVAGGRVAGDYVCIAVSDTGGGMTEAVRARAFEAFFTTKPTGRGTGLGLSMIDRFVRQSDGWAQIDSAPGKGTTIRLFLPACSIAAKADVQAASPPIVPSHGETILVVEDEMVVRALIAEVLRERGYAVVEAADGPEGLAALIGPAPIDLVVSDIGLPGLGGREMIEVARAQRPNLKILMMTGHANEPAVATLKHGPEVITKPFAMDVLVARVQAMLAEA